MASPLLLIFMSLMVTSAVAPPDVDTVMVLPVAVELSRCEITGALSAALLPPCCTL